MTTKRFMTSDLHLFHNNIIEYCRPQFDNIKEMNEGIIDNWNAIVKPKDTVWILGDVMLSPNMEEDSKILSRLNGDKKLVLGNHDNPAKVKFYQEHFSIITGYKEFGGKNGILCSHYPVHTSQLDSKRYKINLHGHLHDSEIDDIRYMNMCLDHKDNDFKPVEWAKVNDRINLIKNTLS